MRQLAHQKVLFVKSTTVLCRAPGGCRRRARPALCLDFDAASHDHCLLGSLRSSSSRGELEEWVRFGRGHEPARLETYVLLPERGVGLPLSAVVLEAVLTRQTVLPTSSAIS